MARQMARHGFTATGAATAMTRAPRRRSGLALGAAAALLSGCAVPYPQPTPSYQVLPYVPTLPYSTGPTFEELRPGPLPLLPEPVPRREPAPLADPLPDPLVAAPPPEPEPEPAPSPPAALTPRNAPGGSQAEQGANAPLQGFRPMRGQTRPAP